MTRTIGILVFNGVEVLDFAGPYEVFTCASRVARTLTPQLPAPFKVATIGHYASHVRARAGLVFSPDTQFAASVPVDVLIVPGGVVRAELDNPDSVAWIAHMASQCELVASVCTGAFLLAQAGLLEDQDVTTHWEDLDELQAMFPRLRVQGQRRWIDNGTRVTSAGISAGIDMSLYLVQRLAGRALALATARQMEYDWNEG
ncbi:MAG: DJ-1/PfpI family protein [Pseudomonadota bacterium]